MSGCSNQFTVPAGVTRMDVTVIGDAGNGGNGGLGAEISGTITVTPGETLYGCVSEGGGAGGTGPFGNGSQGGGYGLLSRFSDLSSPFAIAGGGGGGGGNSGGAGGDAGLPGGDARDGETMTIGGAGGGRGANAGGASSAGLNSDSSGAEGVAGTIRGHEAEQRLAAAGLPGRSAVQSLRHADAGAHGGQAHAAQSSQVRVLARFSGFRIAAGRTRRLSLRLPASFVKAQQKKGVRKLRTTLTVRTTLGSGQTVTRRQAVTIVIPRARAAQRSVAPRRPSFTG